MPLGFQVVQGSGESLSHPGRSEAGLMSSGEEGGRWHWPVLISGEFHYSFWCAPVEGRGRKRFGQGEKLSYDVSLRTASARSAGRAGAKLAQHSCLEWAWNVQVFRRHRSEPFIRCELPQRGEHACGVYLQLKQSLQAADRCRLLLWQVLPWRGTW